MSGTEEQLEFDFEGAVEQIGEELGFEEAPEEGLELGEGEEPSKEGEPEGKPAPAVKPVAQDLTKQPQGQQPQTPLEAPKTWRKEAQAHWATLQPEVQQEILKREEDMFRGLEGYKQQANFGSQVGQILQPYEAVFRQHNIDPLQQIQGLMRSHYTLAFGSQDEKLALMHEIISNYGIDLEQVAATRAPYTDPAVQALTNQFRTLQSELQTRQQREVAEAQQRINSAVEAFASDPANVYFNDLADDMTVLLKTGVAKDLPDAYNQAIWRNPAVRAKELERQAAERDLALKKARTEHAQRAQTVVASQVSSSRRSGSAAAPVGSLDDTLNETLAAIHSRG